MIYVVVQEGAKHDGGLPVAPQLHVEQEPVLRQLQGNVVALTSAAVEYDSVLLVRLEPEPEGVSQGIYGKLGEAPPDERFPVKVQHVGNVVAAVQLEPH